MRRARDAIHWTNRNERLSLGCRKDHFKIIKFLDQFSRKIFQWQIILDNNCWKDSDTLGSVANLSNPFSGKPQQSNQLTQSRLLLIFEFAWSETIFYPNNWSNDNWSKNSRSKNNWPKDKGLVGLSLRKWDPRFSNLQLLFRFFSSPLEKRCNKPGLGLKGPDLNNRLEHSKGLKIKLSKDFTKLYPGSLYR